MKKSALFGTVLSRGHIKRHYRDDNLTIRVVRLVEDVAEVRFIRTSDGSFVAFMLRHNLGDFLQHLCKVGVPVEDHDRSLGVATTHIRKQLINGFEELLLASPELAFCDEDVLAVSPDLNVCLALEVESLTCSPALIL